MKNSCKIPPYFYIHVQDKNQNVTNLVVGPKTFIRQDHEEIITGDKPLPMIVLPPRSYCKIKNPVQRDQAGNIVKEQTYDQVKVKYGEVEIRFAEDYPEPFPLFPKEELELKPTKLQIVKEFSALKIEASRNFTDENNIKRQAGDQWLFKGPATYRPRIEQDVVQTIQAEIIGKQQALKLRAKRDTVNSDGKNVKTGEQWLVKTEGAYLIDVNEEKVELQNALLITNQQAIQLKATQQFTDGKKVARKAGEEWMITDKEETFHLLDVNEELVKYVPVTVLNRQQYCVISNPFDPKTGKNQLGAQKLIRGETSFFLMPGEEIEDGIHDIYLLEDNQALLLRANKQIKTNVNHKDEKTGKIVKLEKQFSPGDRWMEYGPTQYIPPIEVEVLEQRDLMSLSQNEGIYVRDIRQGNVRSVIGQSYMLKAHEQLFNLQLGETIEKLLASELSYKDGKREEYKVVTMKCPFNSAVQIYDFKQKTSRIVFGPNLVTLGPDEQFTVSSLSGGNPKRPGVVQTLFILLGPTFSADTIIVETSDHAQLKLLLSYNWQFRVNQEDKEQKESSKIFQVKDFIGDMCNLMASTIRATVAQVTFDTFHQTSAKLIRKAIFGTDEKNKIKDFLLLEKNNLVITNVDIQNVEPVDQRTRDSLQKTVTLAIEITTNRQEAQAKQQAQKAEQTAKGELEKLKIEDKSEAEKSKQQLLELEAESKAVSNQGKAIADAKAQVQAEMIDVESNLSNATLEAEAKKIEYNANLARTKAKQKLIFDHEKRMAELEINKNTQLALVESEKFQAMVTAIGKQTIIEMANAGPEMQAKLLEGLGLKGFIMTDGNNPINLFNTAAGLIGQGGDNQNIINTD